MAYEFRLPDIGEGVVEGEIVAWKVKEGDTLREDQPMVEIMTDKATVEIPSPKAGRVSRILFAPGQVCKVGQTLLVIEEDGVQTATTSKAAESVVAHGGSNGNGAAHATPATAAPASAPRAGRALATPATRRMARELGVDLETVPGSGPAGRVTAEDLRRAAGGAPVPVAIGPDEETRAYRAPVSPGPSRPAVPVISEAKAGAEPEERLPFRGLRKRIAENMVKSKFTATHFTYVEEVDMSELVALRARAKKAAEARGAKLSYLPFIVKAIVAGLKKHPILNAQLDEARGEIILKRYYHVGIATQTPQGLTVTVVRHADQRSLLDLSLEIDRLAEAARAGKAKLPELTGSTFTISSLGALGGVLATPIINYPEVAIVGVHKIKETPVVRDGQIVVRHMMNLSISLDHRVVDGYDGAMFLQDVVHTLEDPTSLFLEMV
jgi:pyruvate dehydrogenase E2 component (dihydrolipoamide acetyltransferase)